MRRRKRLEKKDIGRARRFVEEKHERQGRPVFESRKRQRYLKEQDADEQLDILYQMLDSFESQFGLQVTNVEERFGYKQPDRWVIMGRIENFVPNRWEMPIHGRVMMEPSLERDICYVFITPIIAHIDVNEFVGGIGASVWTIYEYEIDRWGELVWQDW